MMDDINSFTLKISMALIFMAFVVLLAQILSRYFLKVPFLIGDEVSRYSVIWIVFL